MQAKVVSSTAAPAAIGPYSQAIVFDKFVFTSGQIPLTAEGQLVGEGIVEQAEQSLRNLEAVLKAAGSSLNQVVKTTVFLQDMNDFATVNEIYSRFFSEHKPARSAVQVARLPKDVKIEIEAVAYLG
ncbi:RidA family protein [Paradesulfitobacterium ferrireducens]|uniref:RidA family protein n=1 Tax=Paradesulfitobacterium ferrireducens TaxID=2816476 RepID=UPI001A8D273C|nr:Rid family detoxifying hydrolase [Paradesulfitobacterium ferrireducens]